MVVVKSISNIFPRPAGKHVNQVNQVRCAKEFSNCLRLLVTVLWTGRKRVSLAARGAMRWANRQCFFGQSMSILIAVVPWAAVACGLARTKIAVWGWRHMADVIFMFSFYDSPCILSLRFSV